MCDALDNDNTYQDCASATAIKSNQSNGLAGVFAKVFYETSSSNQLTRPFDEDDADGDNYVECSEYDQAIWLEAGGQVSIIGGEDCNDQDALVFPAATEYCDGQFNDCSDVAYAADGAPEDESDIDGDGFVECNLTNGVPWAVATTDPTTTLHYIDANNCACDGECDDASSTCLSPSGAGCVPDVASCVAIGGYGDCDDSDSWVYPGPIPCDGQWHDCSNGDYSAIDPPTMKQTSMPMAM